MEGGLVGEPFSKMKHDLTRLLCFFKKARAVYRLNLATAIFIVQLDTSL